MSKRIYFLILIALLVLGALELVLLRPSSPSESYLRCKRLRLGMSEAQVIEVMGRPERIFISTKLSDLNGYRTLLFENPMGASAGNFVYLNPITGRVDCISCDESYVGKVDPRVSREAETAQMKPKKKSRSNGRQGAIK